MHLPFEFSPDLPNQMEAEEKAAIKASNQEDDLTQATALNSAYRVKKGGHLCLRSIIARDLTPVFILYAYKSAPYLTQNFI